MPGERDGLQERLLAEAGRHLGYGLTWALSTALFLLLGWVADGWLGTTPLLTVVGAFVGAGAGFYSLYHHMVVKPREEARRRESERGERGGDATASERSSRRSERET